MWSDQREPDAAAGPEPRSESHQRALARARAAHAEFLGRLQREMPRAWVTQLLVAANVGVYALMIARGVDPISPQPLELVAWGAGYGPRTTNGEWWRLFTSTFLHFGLLHIGFNMWVLWSVGPLVERILGHAGFLALYVVSGLLASLTSLLWNPQSVSAGASGAIFGVVGGLLGVLALRPPEMPAGFTRGLRRSMLEFVGYNVLLGALVPHIGLAAHLGGLAAGFLCGLSLGRRGLFAAARQRQLRALETALLGLGMTIAGALLLPRDIPDVWGAVEAFSAAEETSLETYNRAIALDEAGEISTADLAEILEEEVLPPWRAARERLAGLTDLSSAVSGSVRTMLEYAGHRQTAWEMQVRGIQSGDASWFEKAAREHERADQLAQESEAD